MNSTIAILSAGVLGFFLSAVFGIVLIPWLHKLKFGQNIYEGLTKEQQKKQGTPTMGGIMFIVGTFFSIAIVLLIDRLSGGDIVAGDSLVGDINKIKLYAGLLMAVAFGLVGFMDDYMKIKKGQNEGLTEMQKTIAEVLVSLAYLYVLSASDNTFIFIPFTGNHEYFSIIFFWIFGLIVIYATVNAVNFTDGVDGLCASVTITAGISFAVMAAIRHYLGVSLVASALAGALIGYLIWNWHPAKCFMGDTGAMFLGGMIVAFAFAIDCPLIILFTGILYVIEALSVVLQRSYYKITHGKRLPFTTPIHHECEKRGWKEEKIVVVFSLVNLFGGAISVLLFWFGR